MKAFWKAGDVVLFQGDSVTDCGRDRENLHDLGQGYPKRIVDIYTTLFPNHQVQFINKGVSGNRTKDLLDRYEADFKNIQPNFISILIGVNDVWRKFDSNDPTPIEVFENNYRTLLTAIRRDNPSCSIMIIDSFVLESLADRASWYPTMDEVIRVIRTLAKEFADYYLPLDGILHSYLLKGYSEGAIAEDGVHPSAEGHGIVAYEYLKCLGIL